MTINNDNVSNKLLIMIMARLIIIVQEIKVSNRILTHKLSIILKVCNKFDDNCILHLSEHRSNNSQSENYILCTNECCNRYVLCYYKYN